MIDYNEKDSIKMDEAGLIIVNPIDAEPMIKENPDCTDALLITTYIERGRAVLVYEKDFLEFMESKGEYFSKE